MTQRTLDLICLGRAAVDLYGEQRGGLLQDMQTFLKYVGGCAANIAVGSARLGLRVAMLTRVGHEAMGDFVRESLAREGIDVSHVKTDPSRLTGLVLLGIHDSERFPLIFFRERCADMAIHPDDFDAAFIGRAQAPLVTGTHFSTPEVDATSRTAMRYAKTAGTRIVLDIDYRPVLWGVAGHNDGESRFVQSSSVTQHVQSIVEDCDLVVGTEEEFSIAGRTMHTLDALRRLRMLSKATFVLKRGARGAVVFTGSIPEALEDGFVAPGFAVPVLNVLGAGDAFMAGFLKGWLADQDLATCCRYANACGALVVSRHGCSPTMPSWVELQHYVAHASSITNVQTDPTLNHLHRVTTGPRSLPAHDVCVFAYDNRLYMEELADSKGVARARLQEFKVLMTRATLQCAPKLRAMGLQLGAIIDEQYGFQALADLAGSGALLSRPIEVSGVSPLAFVGGDNVSLTLRTWPRDHVIKCLVRYHPHAPERTEQIRRIKLLYDACLGTEHELLLEVLPPVGSATDATTLPLAMTQIYDAGIFPDWWKLQAPSEASGFAALDRVIDTHDPHCRGILLLGGGAGEDDLESAFALASPRCKGFAVGRTIFAEPLRLWLAGSPDDTVVSLAASNYERVARLWHQRKQP